MATVKILTNVPLTMRLKYCNYFLSDKAKAEGWQAQLALKGVVDGQQATVYVPLPAGKDLVAIGAIIKTGEKDKFGHPAFKVRPDQPEITILRTEDGKKKLTTITLAGPNGSPPKADTPQPTNAAPRGAQASWERLAAVYGRCIETAQTAWVEATGNAPDNPTLHAAAATLFIEANRQSLTVEEQP